MCLLRSAFASVLAAWLGGFPLRASAEVTVTGLVPAEGSILGPPSNAPLTLNLVQISARFTSDYALQSVIASVGAASTTLSCDGGLCRGTLDISSVPSGPTTLRVVVTDTFGTSGERSNAVIVDRAPTFVAPVSSIAVDGRRHLRATCTDAEGPCSLKLTIGTSTQPVAVGDGSIDHEIDWTTYDPKTVDVFARATDSRGTSATLRISALVQVTSAVARIDTVAGTVLDADGTRTLYMDVAGRLVVKDRGSSVERVLDALIGTQIMKQAYLTASGAVWYTDLIPGAIYGRGVREDRDGNIVDVRVFSGNEQDYGFGNVAGDWAAVAGRIHNLRTGVTSDYLGVATVASDGSYFWKSPAVPSATCDFGITRGSATTKLGSVPSNGALCADIAYDWIKFAYDGQYVVWSTPQPPCATWLFDGSTTLQVGQGCRTVPPWYATTTPTPGTLLNSGWALFDVVTDGGTPTVRRRSPAGVMDYAAPFSDNAKASAIGPTGEAIVIRRGIYPESVETLYRAKLGSAPELIGTPGKRSVWVGDRWLHLVADTVYQVREPGDPPNPGTDPGPIGTPDAGTGTSDAGTATSPDAAFGTDASTQPDASEPPDADAEDSGMTPDADDAGAEAPDAESDIGEGEHGGTSIDGGDTADASISVEGGVSQSDGSATDRSGEEGGDDGCTVGARHSSRGPDLWFLLLAAMLLGGRGASRRQRSGDDG